jgi:hypothetical protein
MFHPVPAVGGFTGDWEEVQEAKRSDAATMAV